MCNHTLQVTGLVRQRPLTCRSTTHPVAPSFLHSHLYLPPRHPPKLFPDRRKPVRALEAQIPEVLPVLELELERTVACIQHRRNLQVIVGAALGPAPQLEMGVAVGMGTGTAAVAATLRATLQRTEVMQLLSQ